MGRGQEVCAAGARALKFYGNAANPGTRHNEFRFGVSLATFYRSSLRDWISVLQVDASNLVAEQI
jgi:hypothetical protein